VEFFGAESRGCNTTVKRVRPVVLPRVRNAELLTEEY